MEGTAFRTGRGAPVMAPAQEDPREAQGLGMEAWGEVEAGR